MGTPAPIRLSQAEAGSPQEVGHRVFWLPPLRVPQPTYWRAVVPERRQFSARMSAVKDRRLQHLAIDVLVIMLGRPTLDIDLPLTLRLDKRHRILRQQFRCISHGVSLP